MELTLFVEHQCNLRCTYCYNGEKYSRRMGEDTARRAIALALDTRPAALEVSFFGGEPLLAPGLVAEAVAHAEREAGRLDPPPALSFAMNTNGTLVDEAAVKLMAPPRRFFVNVSLDGPPDVHDRVRRTAGGRGSFDAVAHGIALLQQAGIPHQILSVVTPESAVRLGDTVRTVLGFAPRKAQLAIDYRAAWDDEAVGRLRRGLRDAGEAWMEAFRAGTAIPLSPLHGKILAHLHGGTPCPSRCLLGHRELTVAPSGRIYPCAQMVGEDRDTSLCIGDVASGLDAARIAHLRAQKDRVEETCRGCAIADRCQSQCGCRHLAVSGELGRVTAALCETESAFVDEADRVAGALHAERCPAFLGLYYERTWTLTPGSRLMRGRTPQGNGPARA